MDNEGAESFDISFIKARAKNLVEGNILNKQLRRIDRQFRRSLMRIESGINEEKRFSKKLKTDKQDYKDKDEASNLRITAKFLKMEKLRKKAYISTKSGSRAKNQPSRNNGIDCEEDDISVSGERLFKPVVQQPKMYFWSQDASTKLAVMTSFYGYQLNVKRSMTEVKLLGQQMYPDDKRVVQSADPTVSLSRYNSMTDVRRAKTSVPANYPEDEFFYNAIKQVPPPTPKMLTTGDLKARENSYMNDPKSRENSFIEVYINEVDNEDQAENRTLPVSRNAESRTKTSNKINNMDIFKDKSTHGDNRPKKFPKMLESPIGYIEKAAPEKINVDMLQAEGKQTFPLLTQRSVGTANGVVRPTKRPGFPLKTRGEATRHQQEILSNRSDDQPKVMTELERSYSHIPILMSEINRLKTTIEFMPKAKCGHYSKSAFGLSMQSAIKKKVFNKSGLPTPFKKNHNTMLKHYGTPIMEQKAAGIQNLPVSVS